MAKSKWYLAPEAVGDGHSNLLAVSRKLGSSEFYVDALESLDSDIKSDVDEVNSTKKSVKTGVRFALDDVVSQGSQESGSNGHYRNKYHGMVPQLSMDIHDSGINLQTNRNTMTQTSKIQNRMNFEAGSKDNGNGLDDTGQNCRTPFDDCDSGKDDKSSSDDNNDNKKPFVEESVNPFEENTLDENSNPFNGDSYMSVNDTNPEKSTNPFEDNISVSSASDGEPKPQIRKKHSIFFDDISSTEDELDQDELEQLRPTSRSSLYVKSFRKKFKVGILSKLMHSVG